MDLQHWKEDVCVVCRNQKIRRLLQLAERYILAIEVLFNGKRSLLPHAATFYGRPLTIKVRGRYTPRVPTPPPHQRDGEYK
jgi:hypothetical protein